ncbi:hypothetical protein [Pseudomonas fluorescens]|uniref:hypothetical protein n=1 Tax=Pseudomonas fluorescens TaxID=294 RepID=UPI00259B8DC1|nr:hypothetical protein [Pseudomonas fluorescens]WJK07653.1 hypothetical protein QR290_17695 [Pseudomonas fluorescens]
MCTMTHFAVTHEPAFVLNSPVFETVPTIEPCGREPLFQVIPAGNSFFHIREKSTGLVRGFREDHNAACALARSLESRIELLASEHLR